MLHGIQSLINKNNRIDPHINTQVNIDNYNAIKDHPNLIIFDIKNVSSIFKTNCKLNVTKKSTNIIFNNICDKRAKDLKLNLLSKENLKNSIELIKNIYKIDYDIFKKYNFYI